MRFIGCFALVVALSPVAAFGDELDGIRVAPVAKVSYSRPRDYGGWIRMQLSGSRCFNVRDQVLADESRTKIRVRKPARRWRCTIVRGTWDDHYTGKRFTDPKRLDIDHVVPLKEAHVSGGHKWPKEKRVEYANHLRDPFHLLAVSLSENRRKGDKDPPSYMPPNKSYHCRYLHLWVSIKKKWELTMDQREFNFVRARLASC